MSAPSNQLRPPATPTYILRGHASPIHGLHIFHKNLRIISGDAEGWIIVWDLVFKRPVAVWKAHEGAVLEVKGFSIDAANVTEVYTHGRDHKLCVWRFRAQDEVFLDKTLPVDRGEQTQSGTPSQPWLVHSLPVNALNFCAFSMLFIDGHEHHESSHEQPAVDATSAQHTPYRSSVLFAVPNALDSGAIDIFHLPHERRVCTIPAGTTGQTGMVMAVKLFFSSSGELYVASAYEDGHVMVFARKSRLTAQDVSENSGDWKWEKLYVSRPHSQPALSIDVFSDAGYFLSSSADAFVVKHPVPGFGSIQLRPEGTPARSVDTRHAGQQGLRIRSDGKIFATAGWDSRVRVYSCKTMKELAVLKWHKEGCYAVAFADVSVSFESNEADARLQTQENDGEGGSTQFIRRGKGEFSRSTVQQQRNQNVQRTHWLAAGSKDGKISLWDIY